MTVTKDDFNKIWASTSSVPTYTFSDTDYQNGWEFVGNLPPTRAMWDEIQRKNDEKMQLLYNGASFWVDSVADLRTANASIGEVYATKGYYTANDGGNGFYVIRADNSDTDDGGSIIILDNGNVAELITDGTVCPEQFGAKGDGSTDDTIPLQKTFDFGKTVCLNKTKIYRAENLTLPEKTMLLGNNATIQCLTTANPILLCDRDTVIKDIILSGIDHTHLASAGLKFTRGYRIKIDNIKCQYCDYAITSVGSVWSVDFGKVWCVSCENGMFIYNGASTSITISNFLHENCGNPLFFKTVSYSHIGVLCGDYANGGEETGWAYGTGHGSRDNSVYTFWMCKGVVVDCVAGENNIGKYFVNILSSDVVFGSVYIVNHKSYEASDRCLFHVSPEVSRVAIGPLQLYTSSDTLTQYEYYYDYGYNFTYGEPKAYLLKFVTGKASPRTNPQIIAPHDPEKPMTGYYSIDSVHKLLGGETAFAITYQRSSNYYVPIHQVITIVLMNNSTSVRIVKGEIIGEIRTNSLLVGSAVFTSYDPASIGTPETLVVTTTTGKHSVALPTGTWKQAWVSIENHCPLTQYSFEITA